MNPKYSIIVPTRNSYSCLKDCIDSILSQQYTDYEIILSDNHSDDGNYEFFKQNYNQKIRLLKPEKVLSMVDHWEWALSHATGEWLIIVGADDGLMPYFFKLADFMVSIANKQGIKVINSKRGGYFFWPGCQKLYNNRAMEFTAYGTYCVLDSINDMFNALLGVKTAINLPMMYTNSLIHKSVYKSIKSQQSIFFSSITPDMSAAAAIVLTEKHFIECGIPFGFVGTSRVSTSYCFASDDPNFDMREVKLNLESELKFNPKVGSLDHENLKNSSTIMEGFRVIFFESLLQSHKLQSKIISDVFDSKLFLNALYSKIYNDLKNSPNFANNLTRLKSILDLNGLVFEDIIHFNKIFTSKIDNFFKIQELLLQSQLHSSNVYIFKKCINYNEKTNIMKLMDAWNIVDRMDKQNSIVDNFIANPIMLKSFSSNS